MKNIFNIIFFYLLNFVVISWFEKYIFYKISRRDEKDIILSDFLIFSKEKYFFILSVLIKLIILLLLFISTYILSFENILSILTLMFFLSFISFYIKIKNSQVLYHREIFRDYLNIFFSLILLFLNLFALNHSKNNSYNIRSFIFLLTFPPIFVLNIDNIKRSFFNYISKGEFYLLNALDSGLFTFLNSLYIVFLYDGNLNFFFLSILVFIFRISLYITKIVFIGISHDLMFSILSLSFFLIVIVNVILKYVIQ